MSTQWTESAFEDWWLKNPVLPDGERLFVLRRQQPLRRVVDLLCLDNQGGLVFLEIKNETSTRTVVGQALEYLSQYQGADLAVLEDEFDRSNDSSLADAYREAMERDLPSIGTRRRVYIVGPSFDAPTAVAADFLSRSFGPQGISFMLVAARAHSGGYSLDGVVPPTLHPIREMQGQLGKTLRGRVVYVLPAPLVPLCWTVGRLDGADRLRLPVGRTLTQRSLRKRSGYLIPIEHYPEVNTSGFGTVWQHKVHHSQLALELGRVTIAGGVGRSVTYHISARYEAGVLSKFRKRQWAQFSDDWTVSQTSAAGLLRELRAQVLREP